jgi:hypothetical protein
MTARNKYIFHGVFSALALLMLIPGMSGQEKKAVALTGYVTEMYSVTFDSLSGLFINDNLIHNRLNFKAYAGEHFTAAIELRNRIFTGDIVRLNQNYSEMIGYDAGMVDMSWNLADKNSFLINTTIDRAYIDVNINKFQVRAGRQRINWGQTMVWNPNDIFNAYSFFDFDYIERPGSDAIRIQYFPSYASSLELTVKGDADQNLTAAGLWRFNRWGYDIQFLAGYVNSEDLMIGTGWSGAIGSYSFRGEFSWFQPQENFTDTTGTGIFTVGIDRVFKDNSMAQLQIMYCNNPVDMGSFSSFYFGTMSSKDLAVSKFSAFGQFTFAVTPLINLSLSGMWFPDLDGYFAGPSFDYSLAENFDFSLIWQHFQGNPDNERFNINLCFLRFKYSF